MKHCSLKINVVPSAINTKLSRTRMNGMINLRGIFYFISQHKQNFKWSGNNIESKPAQEADERAQGEKLE